MLYEVITRVFILSLALAVLGLAELKPIEGEGSTTAVALVALGYSFTDADQAVRRALEEGAAGEPDQILRRALSYR